MIPGDGRGRSEAEFSLSRTATEKIEELDLAPMVDVAFNLVLFFMVTATTVLYKTLEIPKPSGEAPAAAVAQGRLARSTISRTTTSSSRSMTGGP